MARVIAMIVGGIFLFSAGLIGTLGVRGKLNAQTLNQFLGREEQTADDADAGHEGDATGEDAAGAEGQDGPAAANDPSNGSGHRAGSAHVPSAKHALEDRITTTVGESPIIIAAPFSDEETKRLFEELRGARAEVIDAKAQLERDRQDLELVRLDLNRRWDEVELREQELQDYAKSLAAERNEIAQRTVLLKEAEVDNLQKLARNVEKMTAEGAAKMLMEKSTDQTAMILRYVKPRETGKILDAMDKDYASQVAERMLGVLEPDSLVPTGGQ